MFAYFRGKLALLLPEEAVVEVSGIAYRFLISSSTHRQLPEPGSEVLLAVLSGLPVQDVHEAILSNAPERLYGITGVGKKTAARIILELRDKILKLPPVGGSVLSPVLQTTRLREDAVNALVTLGFSRPSVQKAVVGILEQNPDLTVEEVVKSALVSIHKS